jgi:signal transduction histidine kinase
VRIPSSLSGRLTAVFAGAAALLVAAAGVGMEALIERAFWAALDGELFEEAETLASIVEVGHGADLSDLVARIGAEQALGPGKFVLVRSADGGLLASAGPTPPRDVATSATAPSAPAQTFWNDTDPFRVASARSASGVVCTIGVPVRHEIGWLRRARVTIGAVAVLLVAIFSALAWAVTTRATAELDRLAAELEKVEAGSLHKRLSPRETNEVGRLVVVLNRLLERLDAAMESLRRFTADAAHELRTPLAALRAHLEVLLGQAGPTPPPSLVDAVEQSERLGSLAEDLLTLSSVESASLDVEEDTVCLDELVRETTAELEPLISDQGRRLVETLEPGIRVRGVPGLLRRLLLNLVDNALRHTRSSVVWIALRAQDGRALLEVRDEGRGLAPDEAELAFQRFRRGTGSRSGSGLGLAICREIARRHCGDIHLESVRGRGTTARVELPLAR